jgi:dGTPase
MRHFTRKEKEERELYLKANGYLSQEYMLSSASKGRARPEERESEWRTDFERDTGRIIHSPAYHRLRDKAQVVLLPVESHLTTRLTHTEDVYQIAVGICSFLGLNEKLAEAIARGHDIGHTPFGHVGEGVLTEIVKELLGDSSYEFHHARYGLEIVDRVEKDGKGLNLTHEVRDGILKHSVGASGLDEKADLPETYEGRVVRLADKIAYTFSDIDDAIRVGLIRQSELPQAEMKLFGPRKSKWIGAANKAVVESSIELVDGMQDIRFRGEYFEAFETIRDFMYKNVYRSDRLKDERAKAQRVVRLVFEHVLENKFRSVGESAVFGALDFVACMTDRSILRYFEDKFLPRGQY